MKESCRNDADIPVLRLNGQFIKREIAGDIIMVPVGETALRFNGMVTLTETAAMIWEELEKGAARETIINRLLEEFDVDRQTAEKDTDEFLQILQKNNFLEN